MRFSHAQQGIRHAQDHLSKVTQTGNVQVLQNDKTISWHGRLSGIQRDIYYPLEYQYLLDRHQYSILLSDGSFFQFYYRFDSQEKLKSAKLAYYPRPISIPDSLDDLIVGAEAALERDDDLMYEHLYNTVELLEKNGVIPTNTSHIRFDYDYRAQSHAASHLQLGGIQDFRIPSNFVPQPLAFVQLCESLICGCDEFALAHINFAKNNHLETEKPSQIISLSTFT